MSLPRSGTHREEKTGAQDPDGTLIYLRVACSRRRNGRANTPRDGRKRGPDLVFSALRKSCFSYEVTAATGRRLLDCAARPQKVPHYTLPATSAVRINALALQTCSVNIMWTMRRTRMRWPGNRPHAGIGYQRRTLLFPVDDLRRSNSASKTLEPLAASGLPRSAANSFIPPMKTIFRGLPVEYYSVRWKQREWANDCQVPIARGLAIGSPHC